MSHSFDAVDEKVAETEFFLQRMVEAENDWFEFRCYLSAFLSAARTITLALQRFQDLPGFADWYASHREELKTDPLARFILETRNDHVHGGPSPVAGGMFYQGKATYRFRELGEFVPNDIVSSCRSHFIALLKIVYDCYVVLGVYIDPQQYYTREHFASLGKTIDHAELEILGWVMTSYIEEGFDEDDRWHELRGCVGECQINHLFNGYLGKVTPQPPIPDRIRDFDSTLEDRGWVFIPAGFDTIEDYMASLREQRDGPPS
ncbi:MAG: hypothetical protein KDA86_27095 [Planctomycetaceae bacterium]|nr:hypothetical protein [Planctomycetaceae bacterium]MCA9113073.1 hypothetical protein [Planctomycetaceae bacterium]